MDITIYSQFLKQVERFLRRGFALFLLISRICMTAFVFSPVYHKYDGWKSKTRLYSNLSKGQLQALVSISYASDLSYVLHNLHSDQSLQASIFLRSSSGVEIGLIWNFSTRISSTPGETNAGREGPR